MGEHIAAVFGFPLIDIHTTAETTIAEIAAQLVAASETPAAIQPELIANIVAREPLQAVGLGYGEAVLRARHPAISALGGVVGRCVPPFVWCAEATQPTHLALLIYSPQQDAGGYLPLLEAVVRLILQLRNTPNSNGVVNPTAH